MELLDLILSYFSFIHRLRKTTSFLAFSIFLCTGNELKLNWATETNWNEGHVLSAPVKTVVIKSYSQHVDKPQFSGVSQWFPPVQCFAFLYVHGRRWAGLRRLTGLIAGVVFSMLPLLWTAQLIWVGGLTAGVAPRMLPPVWSSLDIGLTVGVVEIILSLLRGSCSTRLTIGRTLLSQGNWSRGPGAPSYGRTRGRTDPSEEENEKPWKQGILTIFRKSRASRAALRWTTRVVCQPFLLPAGSSISGWRHQKSLPGWFKSWQWGNGGENSNTAARRQGCFLGCIRPCQQLGREPDRDPQEGSCLH